MHFLAKVTFVVIAVVVIVVVVDVVAVVAVVNVVERSKLNVMSNNFRSFWKRD